MICPEPHACRTTWRPERAVELNGYTVGRNWQPVRQRSLATTKPSEFCATTKEFKGPAGRIRDNQCTGKLLTGLALTGFLGQCQNMTSL